MLGFKVLIWLLGLIPAQLIGETAAWLYLAAGATYALAFVACGGFERGR